MTNQHSLKIRPMDLRQVLTDALALVGNQEGRQCYLSSTWVLPWEWEYSLPATLIAWAVMSREKTIIDPSIMFQGQWYCADNSMAVCSDPQVLLAELRDFVATPEVLEAVYEEQFMDRFVQPMQLIHNLNTTWSEGDDLARLEATVSQLEDSIRKYAPDFC